MDPNMPVGPKLTREQILYEQECCLKISDLYAMGYTGMLGTFLGVGGATLLALKGRGLVAKVLIPTLTGGVATIAVSAAVFQVSVFFQMIITKLIYIFRKTWVKRFKTEPLKETFLCVWPAKV